MKKGDLIEITWDDAFEPAEDPWVDDDEFNKRIKETKHGDSKSSGYFYKKENGYLYIYGDVDRILKVYGRTHAIPVKAIIKIKKLGVTIWAHHTPKKKIR